jgi:hypothetical protein
MPVPKHKQHLYKTPQWLAARPVVRERAKNTCEKCGRLNRIVCFVEAPLAGTELYEGLRVLIIQCGVAHLNGVAGDDRLENLAFLCRGCHLRADVKFHVAHSHESRSQAKDEARPLLAASA